MNTFTQAVVASENHTETTNGMGAFVSTLDVHLDLFFNIGSARNDIPGAIEKFDVAFKQDPILALKILFWARDVRGGAGEREVFRQILKHLEATNTSTLIDLLHLVPEYGRWDDLLVFDNAQVNERVISIIKTGLENPQTVGLCAKWLPRKGFKAKQLREALKLSPKAYRKTLVAGTKVVETQMCAKQWDEINFQAVPSVASARYASAFTRNAPEKYAEYLAKVATGEAKINASAIFPHDVIKTFNGGNVETAEAQWNALPNFLGEDFILPIVDVSGSMTCKVGGKSTTSCMDVSVALGLYLATKQKGAFADIILTFTDNPTLQKLYGSFEEKILQIQNADWGGSTNIQAAFKNILTVAVAEKVDASEMPKYLLVLSDMQFDAATNNTRPWDNQKEYSYTVSAHKLVTKMYADAGYTLPKIVYWNLNGAFGNRPITKHETGAALVSGFSPLILKAILSAKEFTPIDVMMETIGSERYSLIT